MKAMKGELAAIIAKAPEDGYWAICPEIPGANGQGENTFDSPGPITMINH